VVDNHNSGLGGGCFILIRDPRGIVTAIDGRERAPLAATAEMYLRDGKADPELSTTGPLAVATPGALAAYDLALKSLGKTKLADLLRPAAQIAEQGFPIDRIYAEKLAAKAKQISQFPDTAAVLLKPDGSPYTTGEQLRQIDLARSYRAIAAGGIDWFYRGPFAEQVAAWMREHGGILTAADFDRYRPALRQPIMTDYRNWKIIGFPPPSSGGVHVAQILNILETFDLRAEHQRDPIRATHLVIEAMKLAFADRAHWLGDADFANVPLGLIDKAYARSLAKRIDAEHSSDVASHGNPVPFEDKYFNRHTTHIAAADSEGYWVAITATVNTTFGSKVIVPGTGIVLNNEMDDFSSQPGVPNAFGLIGAENNAIAPLKRPLSSMSPTIVLDRAGQPVMTVGAAGGPKIITQVLLAITRSLDLDQSLSQAIAGPRFHHQWRPDTVLVENASDDEVTEGLQKYGHKIERSQHSGITQGIGVSKAGELIGVHDPRVPGKVGRAVRRKSHQTVPVP
jgi:gamma-glutamyltranspeptidase/glutathione hydrolase